MRLLWWTPIAAIVLSLIARCSGFAGCLPIRTVVVTKPLQHIHESLPLQLPTRTTNHHNQKTLVHGGSTLFMQSSAASTIDGGGEGEEEQGDTTTSGGTAKISDLVFNLVKSIVGAGVLALPSGIAAFGNAPSAVIPATVLIGIIGCVSAYGFGLIGRSCSLTGTTTYRDAWSVSVSEQTSWIPAWSVTLKTMFAALAYSMILRDTFTSLLLAAGYSVSRVTVLLTVTTTVLFPLCLLKNLSSLAPFSLLGSLGMIYTAIAMFIRYADHTYRLPLGKFVTDLPKTLQPSFGTVGASGVFTASSSILLGMLSTAFMAHFNAPKFYAELKNNTIPRFMTVVLTSFAVSIAIFASMAAMGFATFGSGCSGLILNNYSPRDSLIGFSKIAVALSLVFSFPLVFVGLRDGLLDLLKVKNRTDSVLNAVSVGILSALTGAALIIEDVSFVMAFAGSTLGNALIYIYPALMFRGAIQKLPKPTKLQNFEVKAALTSAVAGFGMGVVGVYTLFKSVVR